ncbi:MAG: tetratricopeptide repeat protein, partial [Acetobacteraceae bacterium]|nr:tetratricopeptide repeat protein [Acetobacteraceae bacterium]
LGALGQGEQARQMYLKALAIAERLAQAEPDRADYQRDVSVSYNNMGDLLSALGQGEEARQMYLKVLAIAERLAQAEPDRADYQVDLAVSLVKRAFGEGDSAERQLLARALSILEALKAKGRLAPADEPKIAALQRMLGIGAPPGNRQDGGISGETAS